MQKKIKYAQGISSIKETSINVNKIAVFQFKCFYLCYWHSQFFCFLSQKVSLKIFLYIVFPSLLSVSSQAPRVDGEQPLRVLHGDNRTRFNVTSQKNLCSQVIIFKKLLKEHNPIFRKLRQRRKTIKEIKKIPNK